MLPMQGKALYKVPPVVPYYDHQAKPPQNIQSQNRKHHLSPSNHHGPNHENHLATFYSSPAAVVIYITAMPATARPGGFAPINDAHVQELGAWPVTQHNKQANVGLRFNRVVSGESQIVSGVRYHLIIDVSNPDGKYRADVGEQTWTNTRPTVEGALLHLPVRAASVSYRVEGGDQGRGARRRLGGGEERCPGRRRGVTRRRRAVLGAHEEPVVEAHLILSQERHRPEGQRDKDALLYGLHLGNLGRRWSILFSLTGDLTIHGALADDGDGDGNHVDMMATRAIASAKTSVASSAGSTSRTRARHDIMLLARPSDHDFTNGPKTE
ncbi:hypothetical protein PR202_ga26662 [Eleusine coracana subsp. coracana]|uniref:Cystatin domain-containing protein n=1 Tax=Eleusine coracana subsp. coracana TaxID=191504 RepID=A0AAV5DFL8_ELECO|nr:hypothetical protein PR202_ga26662 [Eleusine coracana subsp. coracana]